MKKLISVKNGCRVMYLDTFKKKSHTLYTDNVRTGKDVWVPQRTDLIDSEGNRVFTNVSLTEVHHLGVNHSNCKGPDNGK